MFESVTCSAVYYRSFKYAPNVTIVNYYGESSLLTADVDKSVKFNKINPDDINKEGPWKQDKNNARQIYYSDSENGRSTQACGVYRNMVQRPVNAIEF